jgi:Niemann-Pick C1 protein
MRKGAGHSLIFSLCKTKLVFSKLSAAQAAFGPFYRIEQLILSTTPAAQSPYQSPSGLPAILTDANIKLLFRMQAAVDALAAPVAGSSELATLQQVCYKPLGEDCATQSILQVRMPHAYVGLYHTNNMLQLCLSVRIMLCSTGRWTNPSTSTGRPRMGPRCPLTSA